MLFLGPPNYATTKVEIWTLVYLLLQWQDFERSQSSCRRFICPKASSRSTANSPPSRAALWRAWASYGTCEYDLAASVTTNCLASLFGKAWMPSKRSLIDQECSWDLSRWRAYTSKSGMRRVRAVRTTLDCFSKSGSSSGKYCQYPAKLRKFTINLYYPEVP